LLALFVVEGEVVAEPEDEEDDGEDEDEDDDEASLEPESDLLFLLPEP